MIETKVRNSMKYANVGSGVRDFIIDFIKILINVAKLNKILFHSAHIFIFNINCYK